MPFSLTFQKIGPTAPDMQNIVFDDVIEINHQVVIEKREKFGSAGILPVPKLKSDAHYFNSVQ